MTQVERLKEAFMACEEGAITVSEFLNFVCSLLPSHEVADWFQELEKLEDETPIPQNQPR